MKLLQTRLNVPYFEKYCPLNKKQPAEDLEKHVLEIFSRRLAVFFEVHVWNILIKLKYQIILFRTWNFIRF